MSVRLRTTFWLLGEGADQEARRWVNADPHKSIVFTSPKAVELREEGMSRGMPQMPPLREPFHLAVITYCDADRHRPFLGVTSHHERGGWVMRDCDQVRFFCQWLRVERRAEVDRLVAAALRRVESDERSGRSWPARSAGAREELAGALADILEEIARRADSHPVGDNPGCDVAAESESVNALILMCAFGGVNCHGAADLLLRAAVEAREARPDPAGSGGARGAARGRGHAPADSDER
jgi:hypothetical protein